MQVEVGLKQASLRTLIKKCALYFSIYALDINAKPIVRFSLFLRRYFKITLPLKKCHGSFLKRTV